MAQVIALDLFIELKRITRAQENKILFHNIEKLTVHYKNTSHTCLNTPTALYFCLYTSPPIDLLQFTHQLT